MKKISIILAVIVLFALNSKAQTTVSDADDNVYNTVTIGTQMWTKENLKTTKYSDGTSIALVTAGNDWSDLITGAYCKYPASSEEFGNLYNFYAVANSKNICPTNWHVATYDEWNVLVSYLGGQDGAASKLKEVGTEHWGTPNTDATNESGFTAFGGGYRKYDGDFFNILDEGYYWQGTETGNSYAYYSVMDPSSGYLYMTDNDKKDGMAVRCIKNTNSEIDHSDRILFNVYPNPAQNFIQFKNIVDGEMLEVYNLEGQIVISQKISNGLSLTIDISELSSGNYFVKLTDSEKNVFSCDFVKN